MRSSPRRRTSPSPRCATCGSAATGASCAASPRRRASPAAPSAHPAHRRRSDHRCECAACADLATAGPSGDGVPPTLFSLPFHDAYASEAERRSTEEALDHVRNKTKLGKQASKPAARGNSACQPGTIPALSAAAAAHHAALPGQLAEPRREALARSASARAAGPSSADFSYSSRAVRGTGRQ